MRRNEEFLEKLQSLADLLLELFKTIKLLAFARKVSIPTNALNKQWTP